MYRKNRLNADLLNMNILSVLPSAWIMIFEVAKG